MTITETHDDHDTDQPADHAPAEPAATRRGVLTGLFYTFGCAGLGIAGLAFWAHAAGITGPLEPIMAWAAIGLGALASLAFAFGACQPEPVTEYEMPKCDPDPELGPAVAEFVAHLRGLTAAELEWLQDAYINHMYGAAGQSDDLVAAVDRVCVALYDAGLMSGDNQDPRSIHTFLRLTEDLLCPGAGNVLIAVYARDMGLITGPYFATITGWWVEQKRPLPARPAPLVNVIPLTAEELAFGGEVIDGLPVTADPNG